MPESDAAADDAQQEQVPSSPKHVFDDDVDDEVKADESKGEAKRDENGEKSDGAESGDNEDREKLDEGEKDDGGENGGDNGERTEKDESEPESNAPSTAQLSTVEDDPDDEQDLFTKITTNPSSVSGLVSEWLVAVQKNGPAAVAELLSLVVRLGRPPTSPPFLLITPAMVVQNSPPESIKEIGNIIRADMPGTVPIQAKDPASRKARRAFEDLWRRLGAESVPSVIFDTDCYETLISWLEAMAGASTRSLRLAACVAAYRMVDGFLDYSARLRQELHSMQKQLATEKKKCGLSDNARGKGSRQTAQKKMSEKGKDLMKKVDEWMANNSELTELADRVFRLILVLKYRDISAEIRALSVTTLGGWTLGYPDHFLDDVHNKYIGWLLSDKDASVRRASIEILSRMAQKQDFFPSIEMFFQRFCGRIAEMAIDKDDGVAVEAIHLSRHLSQYDILDQESCERICDIAVEGPGKEMRRAAGHFLVNLLQLEKGGDETDLHSKGGTRKKKPSAKRQKKPKLSNPFLAEIPPVKRSSDSIKELLFAITRKESIEEVGTELAVDAVWDHMPALRCWDAFLAILCDKDEETARDANEEASGRRNSSPGHDDPLSDDDKATLCGMLLTSAREASGLGDAERRKRLEACDFDDAESPAALLTAKFLPELCRLLVQYQADTRALAALVQLPMYFHMGSVEHEGNQKHFEEVILKLIDIMSRYTRSPELVGVCASTFKALLTSDTALKKLTLTSLQLGCSNAAKELSLQVRADLSKAEPLTVAAAVLRIKVMSELVEPNTSVHSSVVKLLEYQIEKTSESELGDEVTADALRTSCALLFWSLSQIRSRLDAADGAEAAKEFLESEEVQEIRSKCAGLLELICQVCSSPSFPVSVRMVSLRALLSALVCCRGVEKFAASATFQSSPEDEIMEDRGPSEPEILDLLQISDKLDTLATTVKSCVIAVVQHQLSIADHSLTPQPKRGRRKSTDLSESSVRDCFASLVQSSFQSVLSERIAQLPIIGLLLKDTNQASRSKSPVWTTYQLCRTYCQQRSRREMARIREELRALSDAVALASSEEDYQVVRQLAVYILALYEPGGATKKAARELLAGLMQRVLDNDGDTASLAHCVTALTQGGLGTVGHITVEDAKSFVSQTDQIEKLMEEHSQSSASLDILLKAVKSVSQNETPDLPKLVRSRHASGLRTRQVTKKRRRAPKDPAAYYTSSPVEMTNVRRSGRDRKKIDYAKLVGMKKDGRSEEEESSGAEASAEEESLASDDDDAARVEPSTAAEVARRLMNFSSSPRVPAARQLSPPEQLPLEPRSTDVEPAVNESDDQSHDRNDAVTNDATVKNEDGKRAAPPDGDDSKGDPTIPPARKGRPRRKRSGARKSAARKSRETDSPVRAARVEKSTGRGQRSSQIASDSSLKNSSGKASAGSSFQNGIPDAEDGKRASAEAEETPVQSSQEPSGKLSESPVPPQHSPQQSPPVRRSKRDRRRRSFSQEGKENIEEIPRGVDGKKRSRSSLSEVVRKKQKKW